MRGVIGIDRAARVPSLREAHKHNPSFLLRWVCKCHVCVDVGADILDPVSRDCLSRAKTQKCKSACECRKPQISNHRSASCVYRNSCFTSPQLRFAIATVSQPIPRAPICPQSGVGAVPGAQGELDRSRKFRVVSGSAAQNKGSAEKFEASDGPEIESMSFLHTPSHLTTDASDAINPIPRPQPWFDAMMFCSRAQPKDPVCTPAAF